MFKKIVLFFKPTHLVVRGDGVWSFKIWKGKWVNEKVEPLNQFLATCTPAQKKLVDFVRY